MQPQPECKFLFQRALVGEDWRERVLVAVDDGVIRLVQCDAGADAAMGATVCNGLAVPGLGNVHSHGFQRGMAGLAERGGPAHDHFWSWREVMYRFLERLTPEDVRAITALAYMEMLESGFTRVGEFHYLHHDPHGNAYDDPATMVHAVIGAVQDSGIGLTLLPVLYRHGGFHQPPGAGQRRFLLTLDDYAELLDTSAAALTSLPGAELGVAPHSLRAVAAHELHAVTKLRPLAPVHIHAAEQRGEVDECIAATGQRPVEWLLEHASVDRRWCLIHATHLTSRETDALAVSGAVAGLCPVTEANLGDGIFPGVDFLAAHGTYAVGTDSNIRISAAEELRALEYSQRLRDGSRNRLTQPEQSTGRQLFATAARGSAQALGAATGSIAPGCRADFVILDDGHEAMIGRDGDTALDCWIFVAGDEAVREVYVGGVRVVADGRHIHRQSIVERWRRHIRRLLES
jgi:formiminoglutamate deiminase